MPAGFVYSTSDRSVPFSNKLSFGKIKFFGKIWERKLRNLLIEKRVSLREAARQLKVDTKTVVRHAERLKMIKNETVATAAAGTQLNSEVESTGKPHNESRAAWLKAQKDYPSLSKTALRKKIPADFMRLYRNDRKWLERNSPKKKRIIICNKRVDWMMRDQQILVSAQNTVRVLQQQLPPVRITTGLIGKILGLRSLLEKHLDKLMTAKAFLLSQVESVEEFQIRRIRWVISKLSSQNGIVKIWEVMRFAGIKNSCSNTIRLAIENVVLEVNSDTQITRKIAG